MIHLNNLAHNSRVDLVYVVEADEDRSKKVHASLGLETTKFVNSTETEAVLADPRFVLNSWHFEYTIKML